MQLRSCWNVCVLVEVWRARLVWVLELLQTETRPAQRLQVLEVLTGSMRSTKSEKHFLISRLWRRFDRKFVQNV